VKLWDISGYGSGFVGTTSLRQQRNGVVVRVTLIRHVWAAERSESSPDELVLYGGKTPGVAHVPTDCDVAAANGGVVRTVYTLGILRSRPAEKLIRGETMSHVLHRAAAVGVGAPHTRQGLGGEAFACGDLR
jgi:hypothetical protein